MKEVTTHEMKQYGQSNTMKQKGLPYISSQTESFPMSAEKYSVKNINCNKIL